MDEMSCCYCDPLWVVTTVFRNLASPAGNAGDKLKEKRKLGFEGQ